MNASTRPIVFFCALLLFLCSLAPAARAATAGMQTPGYNSAYPGNGFALDSSIALQGSDFTCALIDRPRGFAWFGWPGRVDRVRLSDNKVQDTLALDGKTPGCLVADDAHEFAYVGLNTEPAKIIKLRMADFSVVATRTLGPGDAKLSCGFVDHAGGYAYFGTATLPPRVIKIRLSDFTPEDVRIFSVDDGPITCAIQGPNSVYAYFGTQDAEVIKIRLLNFAKVYDPLHLQDRNADFAVMSPDGLTAWFIGGGLITTVDVASFTSQGTNLLIYNEDIYVSARCVDQETGRIGFVFSFSDEFSQYPDEYHGYFGVHELFEGSTGFPSLFLGTDGAQSASSALLDGTAGKVYLGGDQFERFDLPSGKSDGATRLGGRNPSCVITDPRGEYAYYATNSVPAWFLQVRLADGQITRDLKLEITEGGVGAAVMDKNGAYACFATAGRPANIIKVRLPDLVRADKLTLDAREAESYEVVLDPAGANAYISLAVSGTARVVKVRLSDFSRVAAADLNASWNETHCIAAVPATDFMYLAQHDDLCKMRFDDLSLEKVASAPNQGFQHLVLDPKGEYAYQTYVENYRSGASQATLKMNKLKLPEFSVAGTIILSYPPYDPYVGDPDAYVDNMMYPQFAVMDPQGMYAYVGEKEWAQDFISDGETYINNTTYEGYVGRVRLSDFTLDQWRWIPYADYAGALDPVGGKLCMAGYNTGELLQYLAKAAQGGFIKATRFTMPVAGTVSSAGIFSHVPSGNVRVAVYDNDAVTRHLLWQSKAAANGAENAYLNFSVPQGSPGGSLVLPAGTYWLAWQIDNSAWAPSLVQSSNTADGFRVAMPFGLFPDSLSVAALLHTGEQWTSRVTYEPGGPHPANAADGGWALYQ